MHFLFACLLLLISLDSSGYPLDESPKQKAPTAARPANKELRKELLRRFKVDQDARLKLIQMMNKRDTDPGKVMKMDTPEVKKLKEIDHDNTMWLKDMIATHGWPGKTLVGRDGANAAWLLVQHADQDRPFQKRCLSLMEAAPRGEVAPSDLALLTDRVLVGEKKKQRFGTQLQEKNGAMLPLPIEDEAAVDKRRAAVGLPPLAQYLKTASEFYLKKVKDQKK